MMLNRLGASTIMSLCAITETLAQASPPAASPPAPVPTDGGVPWFWIIIALAIIGGLVWYFMRGRPRTTPVSTTDTSDTPKTPTGRANVYDNNKRK
jgi:hypothetical protein